MSSVIEPYPLILVGNQKDRQEPALFWESLFWGVPDQQLLWRYFTQSLVLGILSSSSIF